MMKLQKTACDYIDSVCRSIRSCRERELFRAELLAHIEQKTAELMRGGKTQEEAERAAVGSLGPAEAISKGMNAVYRPSAAKYIFLAATLFLAFLNAAPWLAFLFNIPNMPLAVFPAEGATAVIGGADGPTSIFVSAGSWSMVSFILPLLLILFAGITVRLFLRPKFGGRNNGMRPRT